MQCMHRAAACCTQPQGLQGPLKQQHHMSIIPYDSEGPSQKALEGTLYATSYAMQAATNLIKPTRACRLPNNPCMWRAPACPPNTLPQNNNSPTTTTAAQHPGWRCGEAVTA
jgi:hypothetical protein